jgi:hypothetical protein
LVKTNQASKLEAEFKKLKLKYVAGEYYRIDVEKRNVHQVIRSISTPLSDIKIHIPTLEDAYLEILSRQNQEQ